MKALVQLLSRRPPRASRPTASNCSALVYHTQGTALGTNVSGRAGGLCAAREAKGGGSARRKRPETCSSGSVPRVAARRAVPPLRRHGIVNSTILEESRRQRCASRSASTAARDNSALPNLFFAPPLRVPPARPHALPPPRAASPAPQAQHLPPLPHARAPRTPQRAHQARRCAAEAQASPRTAKTSTRPPVLRSP